MKKRSKVLSILCSMTALAGMFGTNSAIAMDDGRGSKGKMMQEIEESKKRKETEDLEKICEELVKVGDARAKAEKELKEARREVLSARVQKIRADKGSLRLSSKGAQAKKAVQTREAAKKKVEEAEKKFKEAVIKEIEDEIKTVEDVKTNLELEGIKVTSISNLGDEFGISNSFEKKASRLATELVKLDILRKDLEIVKNMAQSIAGTCKVVRDVSGESKSPELVERTHSYTTKVLNRARRIVTALSTYKDDYKLSIGEDIIIRVISGKNRDIRSLISSGYGVNCPEMWTAGFLKSLESYGAKKIDKESLISMVDEIMNNTEGVKNVAFRALIAFARCVWRSNGSSTEPVNGLSFEEVVSTYIKLAKIADNYLYQDIIEAARVARAARVTYRFFRAENINTNGVPEINRGIIQMVEDEYRNVSRG